MTTMTKKRDFHQESLFARNDLQFPRLLAEIRAVSLNARQYADLRESMDLTDDEIDQVFERAEKEFEKIKEAIN